MDDFELLRRQMVEEQLIARGIKETAPFYRVPRHEFVPEGLREAAYEDRALPIGDGQTISQPYMVALMTELLRLKKSDSVLEVGTGSGYQAAILAELSHKVYTIERVKKLSEHAKNILDRLNYSNIEYLIGDGTEGYQAGAPYNGIIITAGCPNVPQPLIDQLTDNGRLVAPVGNRVLQSLTVVTKEKDKLKYEYSVGCAFVPLIGKYAWRE